MNNITIIGNLARDPEARTTNSGKEVADFTVAVNTGYGDKKTTIYFKVSAWDGLTKVCKYLSKGKKVAVVGSVSCRAYTNKDGQPSAQMEINARELELLSPKEPGDEFKTLTNDDMPF